MFICSGARARKRRRGPSDQVASSERARTLLSYQVGYYSAPSQPIIFDLTPSAGDRLIQFE